MSPTDETTVSQVLAALGAAGDVAYRWDLHSDEITWYGPLAEALGIADPAVIAAGRLLAGAEPVAVLSARQDAILHAFADQKRLEALSADELMDRLVAQ